MNKKAMGIAGLIALNVGMGLMMLPKILRLMGLDPQYKGKEYDLNGKKALIITTSHGSMGSTKKKTGVYASEMTVPYYAFLDANMAVDLASIEGHMIPIEPISLKYPLATLADKRFLSDKEFKNKVKNALKIDDLNFENYDLIFIAGGWGAAYDLGVSEVLGRKITAANAKRIILGSVCHGALGFLKAKEINGEPLVKDKKITAVTNRQIKELNIQVTPMHPETELRKKGAEFMSNTACKDIFANLTVVDGNIVTGQNQNAASETAQKMMKKLAEKV